MTYTLIPNIWYTITPETDCDIETPNGISIHLPAGIQYFHFADSVSIDISGTATITQNPPLFKPASASALGGGFIESNLRIGHGAADAVKAVCTLTLGEPTDAGTLVDNAGHELHLNAAPATYAHDFWAMTHPTAGGVLVVGDHTFAAVAEKAERAAFIELALGSGYGTLGQFEFGVKYQGSYLYDFAWMNAPDEVTPADLETALNDEDNWSENGEPMQAAPFVATWDSTTERMTLTALAKSGEDGNNLTYDSYALTPFEEPAAPDFSGGQNARTLDEALELAVSTINDDEDSPIRAEVGEDALGNKGIAVYALEVGSGHDYDCTQTTGQFFQVSIDWESDGQDARTLDEVAAAITAEGSDFADEVVVTHASGASTLTLTAATAGKAANAIVYTSTGCFGGETVKQGSTTRGKDAVAQTAFKIFLNGEVLDVEPAPTPEELEEDTAMKNHGVYLVTADATAQDFTGITLADNATAEIWLTCTSDDNSVALPGSTEGWIWLDAMPDMAAGKTYAVAARNVGNAVLARPIYDYTTPAAP